MRNQDEDYQWGQKGLLHKIGRHQPTNHYLEQYRAILGLAYTWQLIHRGKLVGNFGFLRRFYIDEYLLEASWSERYSLVVTDGLIIALDEGDKDESVSFFGIDAKPMNLMIDLHMHLSMSIAMPGIVDTLSK